MFTLIWLSAAIYMERRDCSYTEWLFVAAATASIVEIAVFVAFMT